MTEHTGQSSIQEIDVSECMILLALHEIGRLGVNADSYPLIFCVNYFFDGDALVIRVPPGTKLSSTDRTHVTFEVDEIDRTTQSGWSVLVRGLAGEVTSAHRQELVDRTDANDLRRWAPGEYGHWLQIVPSLITGSRVVPGELPSGFSSEAYL